MSAKLPAVRLIPMARKERKISDSTKAAYKKQEIESNVGAMLGDSALFFWYGFGEKIGETNGG